MSKNKKLNKDIDLKENDNFDGPSLKELNFGLWLSEKRVVIRRLFVVILIIISASLFIYSAYNYFIYFKYNNSQNNKHIIPVQSPHKIVDNLKLGSVYVFNNYKSSDLAVKVINPNNKFAANFSYCFIQNDQNLVCKNSFIMPQEEKYILDLGQVLKTHSGNVKFKISQLSWQRVDAHKIPDWNKYSQNHLNFLITNLKFNSTQNNNNSSRKGFNTLSFLITNKSPYSYYEVPLNISFFNNFNLSGVNLYFLENFLSGQERKIEITWPGNISGVNRTEIKPDLNLLDKSIYLKYQGQNLE